MVAALIGAAVCGSGSALADDPPRPAANPFVLHIPVCSATDMMIADLDQIDGERGFGRGGAVVTAIEELVRQSSAAPSRGVADLELVVRTDGTQTLKVLWAARQRSDWESFATGVEHLVTKEQVRIPERSLGMTIVVRVDARQEFPDGCPVGTRGEPEAFDGAHPVGCGTRAVAAPSYGRTCGRRRRSAEALTRVVHARIMSEARIPDPAQPTQRTKS